MPGLRLKARNRRYRVTDVMVLDADASARPLLNIPRYSALRSCRPNDRMPDLVTRAAGYADVGVPLTWILDPASKWSYI